MIKFTWQFFLLIFLFNSFNVCCETFIFCHGYGSDASQSLYYKQIMPGKIVSFNFPEVNLNGLGFNNVVVNFGQEGDIAAIKRVVDGILFENPQEEIVLVGVSRGASAIMNYASQYPSNIKAMVLESPFDDLLNVVDNYVLSYKIGWLPGVQAVGRWLASVKFPAYKSDGITPLKSLDELCKYNIPMLFVHSYEDSLVPIACSDNLISILLDKQNNVFVLKLSSGVHAKYYLSANARRYFCGVHAFYKKFNIAHDDFLANHGECEFIK